MSLRGDVKYYNKCYGYYSHFSLSFYFTFKGRLVFLIALIALGFYLLVYIYIFFFVLWSCFINVKT